VFGVGMGRDAERGSLLCSYGRHVLHRLKGVPESRLLFEACPA